MVLKTVGALCALALLPAFAQAQSAPLDIQELMHGRRPTIQGLVDNLDGTVTSGNWSGYAVTGKHFNKAKGSWIVPAITCTTGTQYAVFWVGIDGYSSSTVEQTGTLAVCSGGTPQYAAWYEFYPAQSIIPIPSITVLPGDSMSASVTYSSTTGKFTVQIKDERSGQSFSTSLAVAGAARSSAEWIAEAPCCTALGNVLPLADYGKVEFGSDYTPVTGTSDATDSSNSGPIGSFPTIEQITMAKNGHNESVPSALTTDGTSFHITWKHK